jgi:hypothetical protein
MHGKPRRKGRPLSVRNPGATGSWAPCARSPTAVTMQRELELRKLAAACEPRIHMSHSLFLADPRHEIHKLERPTQATRATHDTRAQRSPVSTMRMSAGVFEYTARRSIRAAALTLRGSMPHSHPELDSDDNPHLPRVGSRRSASAFLQAVVTRATTPPADRRLRRPQVGLDSGDNPHLPCVGSRRYTATSIRSCCHTAAKDTQGRSFDTSEHESGTVTRPPRPRTIDPRLCSRTLFLGGAISRTSHPSPERRRATVV